VHRLLEDADGRLEDLAVDREDPVDRVGDVGAGIAKGGGEVDGR
jgi:hypothetical protein